MSNNLRVKHWAFLTVLLYGVTCAALVWPVIIAAFAWREHGPNPREALDIYKQLTFWLIIDVLMVLQCLFLLLPIEVAKERPVPRRRWVFVAIAAALMMGVLVGGLVCAVGEAVTLTPFIIEDHGEWIWAVSLAGLGWVAWTIVFLRQAFAKDSASAFDRAVRCLITGSVAELLVAIPCHVYVRSKDYCCAGVSTTFGLLTGLAVLLFAFGPGVLFLFVARARRLRGRAQTGEGNEEDPPRQSVHTRDAVLWLGVGVLFLLMGAAGGLLSSEEARTFTVVCRVSFSVFFGMATLQIWRAARKDESHWFGVAVPLWLAGAALLLLLGWWW
ncbi:MAG: hypothetical protein NTW87_30120 [Planctomycetota bacterium]|nr:hypothetical protein [Planctomycetota bacterium]